MDEWVRAWLEERRGQGEKCLEIKYIQNKPYVYRSTSVYDKTTKSPKKVSAYLGRLTREEGLIPKGSRRARPSVVAVAAYHILNPGGDESPSHNELCSPHPTCGERGQCPGDDRWEGVHGSSPESPCAL